MGEVYVIVNQKGGVGKTTTALNLAAGFVKKGKKVLCIDLDPQGNLTDYLGYVQKDDDLNLMKLFEAEINALEKEANEIVEPHVEFQKNKEDIYFIPSHMDLAFADISLASVAFKEQLLKRILGYKMFESYDYIICDCQPTLGILVMMALVAADQVIIPVQAQKFALDGLVQLEKTIMKVKRQANNNLRINGILITMADATNMSKEVERALRSKYGDGVYKTKISRRIEAPESTLERMSMTTNIKSTIGKQYMLCAEEIMEREARNE